MPRFLILYGTTDGHTAKIARFLADEFRSRHASVDVVDAGTASPDPRPYDGVLVAGSLHAKGYQRSVLNWARTHAAVLRKKPAAFLSVCLGVLQKDEEVQRDLRAIKARFVAATEWNPVRFLWVAGALPYTRYGWLKRMVMRHMARKAGGDTDTSRDHEYTDWEDLRRFAADFAGAFRPPAPRPSPQAADGGEVPEFRRPSWAGDITRVLGVLLFALTVALHA